MQFGEKSEFFLEKKLSLIFYRKSTTVERISSTSLENGDGTTEIIFVCRKSTTAQRKSSILERTERVGTIGIIVIIGIIPRKWCHLLRRGPPYLTRRRLG